jgi:hypothetical protein
VRTTSFYWCFHLTLEIPPILDNTDLLRLALPSKKSYPQNPLKAFRIFTDMVQKKSAKIEENTASKSKNN